MAHLVKGAEGHGHGGRELDPLGQLAAQVGQVLGLGAHHAGREGVHAHRVRPAPRRLLHRHRPLRAQRRGRRVVRLRRAARAGGRRLLRGGREEGQEGALEG
eukprot:364985-Prorocentrum_minimum.AAC.1